jgi:hypothetical protein
MVSAGTVEETDGVTAFFAVAGNPANGVAEFLKIGLSAPTAQAEGVERTTNKYPQIIKTSRNNLPND